MLAKLLRIRRAPRADHVGVRRARSRLWADTRGGVSYIEYIVIIGFIGLAAIGGFKRLRATTWNTVRSQGIAFREIGGAGDIAPVTLAKANVPKMPLPGGGFPSGDGKVHLPVIQPKCFVAGTPVATETGLRPIESIAVGERVWARNEQTGEDALARVVQRFITPDSHVIGVDIPIDVARHEVLRVTENHRFYVPDRGWVPARELDGSRLVSIVPRGPPLTGASAIESWGERTTVYNIEVEGLHTYFVGEARVLVHNANEKDKDCTDADDGAAARAATAASVADKLERYLLNPTHPIGGPKAKWFQEALGYTRENSGELARQIVFDAGKAVQTGVTEHGTKYNQVISITGANGRVIDVTFAWIRNNDGIVRLVTAIPTKR